MYIRRKCGNKQLSSSIYLSEAEPFLEQFAKRSPQNQALIGSAGSLVRTEDFLAIVEGGQDEEGDLMSERDIEPSGLDISVKDTVPKHEGMIVFFPGNSFTNLVAILNIFIYIYTFLVIIFEYTIDEETFIYTIRIINKIFRCEH